MSQLALSRIKKCLINKETHLDLGLCGLTTPDFLPFAEVRKELVKCSHIETLVLSNSWYDSKNEINYPRSYEGKRNTFVLILKSIAELSQLTKLVCCADPGFSPIIRKLDGIGQLTNLAFLDISNNDIPDFKELNNLKNLQFLKLRNTGITDLSDIKELHNLMELDISNNSINQVKGFDNIKNLKSLELSFNKLAEVQGLEHLTSLEILDLSHNAIEKTKFLNKLSSLRELYISANQISNLEGLKEIKSLEVLVAASNSLKNLNEIELLKNLQSLDVSYNKINNLSGIRNLVALKELNLSANDISDLEPLLRILQREHYPMKIDTEQTIRLKDGQINVSKNPIRVPDMNTVQQGRKAILAYFENLKISKLVPFREGKVIFLGEPDAGKTNLLNYFLGKPFEEEKSVTRGVNIAKHSFEHESDNYQINFWDFGGQEVQQSVHQYFLTDNTLYVIVLNSVTDEQPDRYLQFLDNHAPNSPFIIVTNKDDLNGNSKLRNNQIWNDYKGRLISSEIRISLRQAANVEWCDNNYQLHRERQKRLEELRELVKKHFLKLPHLEQGFLLNYKTVKELVEEIYENEKKPYITMEQFQNYCEDAGIATGTERDLLRHLNFIGTVRYMDKDNLRGLHILNPEWLSDGIYRIITDNDVKNIKNGKIEKVDIKRILAQTQESKYVYLDNEIDFIITMMCHFRVAYYDDQNKFIYIPNSFPEDLPSGFDKGKFKTGAIHYFFIYKTEIPSYIINRFIVKTFTLVQGNIYWNKGIVLEDKEHDMNYCEALIEQNDRIIDIWIKGKDIQMFFARIREAIRNSHEESFTKFEEMIDLGFESYSYQTILNLMFDGDKYFKSQKIIDPLTYKLKLYNINSVLGRFESVDEIIKQQPANISIDMSGGNFIVHGQIGSGNTLDQSQQTQQLLTPTADPTEVAYKNKRLKYWKRNAWILFLASSISSIVIVLIYMQDSITFLNTDKWLAIKKSPWVTLGAIVLPLWNAFVIRLWYERIFDKSKQKAYLDSIKTP